MKKNKFSALLLAFVMLFSQTVFAEKTEDQQQAEVIEYSNYMQKKIVQVYAHAIADNYYYGIEDEELLYSVICSMIDEGKFDINKALMAMLDTLKDDYAEFYTPEEYKTMTENVSGEFSGIGVTISDTEKGVLVISVIENSPAYKAGVLANDYIIGVNGQSVIGKSSSQVREMVVGTTGTEVKVRVLRGKEEHEITCVRDTIEVSQIETEIIDEKTGYIKLVQFTSNAPKEMESIVKDFRAKGIKNVVLDLRNNPGGELQAAIDIANIFVSAGKIAEIRYKDNAKNTFLYSKNYNAPRFNMTVLVNEHSASASEFLSMVIQSRGVGKIVGTNTFGKGSMQVITRAINGAGFKYTIGEFYSYKGQRINTIGITPDIYVENTIKSVDEEAFTDIDFDRISEGVAGGDMTLALEQRLVALGYMSKADEVFDETTKDAVSRFQAVVGYEINGIPGVYEYMFLNDYDYTKLDQEIDLQKEAALKQFK